MFLKKDIMKMEGLETSIETRKNMGRCTYTIEKIEAIAEKFRNMPPPEQEKMHCSKQEAVSMLYKEIQALQKRGYKLEQIAEALRGEGLEITTPTLKSYLQRAQLQKQKPKPTPGKKKTNGGGESSRATFTPRPDTEDI
jgi:hypothetical protein